MKRTKTKQKPGLKQPTPLQTDNTLEPTDRNTTNQSEEPKLKDENKTEN